MATAEEVLRGVHNWASSIQDQLRAGDNSVAYASFNGDFDAAMRSLKTCIDAWDVDQWVRYSKGAENEQH